jgi:uncharacterized protein (DUF1800 family)
MTDGPSDQLTGPAPARLRASVMTQPLSPAAIALNRFGLGARPGDGVGSDPQRDLTGQFDRFDVRPGGFTALPDAGALVQRYRQERRAARQATNTAIGTNSGTDAKAMLQPLRQERRDDMQALYRAAVQARADAALATDAPFVERMVHFWANHFCVSADNAEFAAFAGSFERDAIRPHVLGRFEDMLLAVEQHPAMLLYLNQANSIGPDSVVGQRGKRARGLNENLGREIMELHTLGVRSGYSQADVTEFARALTGWTIEGLGPGTQGGGDPNRFTFRPQLHEPGIRTILGKRYEQPGEGQARAALIDFAHAPATATHVATKLARHFAGDDPPPPLIERLARAFVKGRGDLPTLYHTLIASPEPWAPKPLKFKTPWEWTISTLRGLGRVQAGALQVAGLENQLGQPVWKPGSPAGYDDLAASWAAPDALMRRVEIAQRLAAVVGDRSDARQLAPRLIPASLSPATAEQIGRAESPAGALALLLVSPDFLRR